ncbi:MAG TPA: HAD-IA family hydrolase [Polyangiaceae bacterium]|nr:HAD-IA family hydrolase [Polyangiaceae bacterium]
MKISAIVFDLDGTLIDSRRDIATACNHALATHGLETLPLAQVEAFVGDGARALLSRAAGLAEEDPRVSQLLEAFLDYYAAHPTDQTPLMPGAAEALAALAELPLAICTNKPRRTTLAVLEGLALKPYFRAINAGGDLPEKKPHPAPLLHLARELGLPPAELLMVGDGPQDVLAGHAAGSITVGVRGGIQAVERLLAAEPHHLLSTLHELPALVQSLSAPSGGTPR